MNTDWPTFSGNLTGTNYSNEKTGNYSLNVASCRNRNEEMFVEIN